MFPSVWRKPNYALHMHKCKQQMAVIPVNPKNNPRHRQTACLRCVVVAFVWPWRQSSITATWYTLLASYSHHKGPIRDSFLNQVSHAFPTVVSSGWQCSRNCQGKPYTVWITRAVTGLCVSMCSHGFTGAGLWSGISFCNRLERLKVKSSSRMTERFSCSSIFGIF